MSLTVAPACTLCSTRSVSAPEMVPRSAMVMSPWVTTSSCTCSASPKLTCTGVVPIPLGTAMEMAWPSVLICTSAAAVSETPAKPLSEAVPLASSA